MKGDFSRITFDPKKHYSGVVMQQGRIQLDSDWNEQVAILQHHNSRQTEDLIGESGTPKHAPGFELRAKNVLSFDGVDDVVVIKTSKALARIGHQDFTLEVSFTPMPGAAGTILSCTHYGDGLRYSLQIDSAGVLSFSFAHRFGEWRLESSEALKLGRPYLVSIVCDEPLLRIFINGVLSSEGTLPHHHTEINASFFGELEELFQRELFEEQEGVDFLLGASIKEGHLQSFFHGEIDLLRVWSHALTSKQVGDDLRPRAAPTPGLVANYRFEEGSGAHLLDAVSQQYSGHLGGHAPNASPAWVCRSLYLGAGRYYVGGLLCENHEDTPINEQADCPEPGLDPETPGLRLAYLDVWTRLITANEDPSLREVALGGPDTTARTKLVWQVKFLPLKQPRDRYQPYPGHEWTALLQQTSTKGKLAAHRARGAAELLENTLYRVEIHHRGVPENTVGPSLAVERVLRETKQLKLKEPLLAKDWPIGQWVELIKKPYALKAEARARVISVQEESRLITLDELSDVIAQENHLFVKKIASFKWSRDNGINAFPILKQEARELTLGGSSVELTLAVGSWVELQDERSVLGYGAGFFSVIKAIDGNKVTLAEVPETPLQLERTPLLRCWDHNSKSEATGISRVLSSDWIELEKGIRVHFEKRGSYHPGDYWLIPTRTATGDVDWPQAPEGPQLLPPAGISHRLVPLALVQCEGQGVSILHDYRVLFSTRHNEAPQPAPGPRPPTPSPQPPPPPPLPHRPEHLPKGAILLSETPSLEGYRASGLQLDLPLGEPVWREREPLPVLNSAAAVGAALERSLFVFLESGEVLEYSNATDQWIPRATLTPRRGFGVAALGQLLYIAGGLEADNSWSTRVECYDPATNKLTKLAPLPSAKGYAGVAALLGGLHIIGGRGHRFLRGAVPLRSHHRYDPSRDAWTEHAPLPIPCEKMGVAALHNKLYMVGGITKKSFNAPRSVGSIYSYHAAQDAWHQRASLLTPRWGIGVAVLREELYLSGGENEGGAQTRLEKFSPATEDITEAGTMTSPKSSHAAIAWGDSLFIVDGMKLSTEEASFSKRLYLMQK